MTNELTAKQLFLSSIVRGTGQAYIILRDNPEIDFSKIIIKCAVKNHSYDNQSEGSRADYIYRLIKKSKRKNNIIKAVLAKLQSEKTDYWALEQMCDLAALFYKAGYTEARTALYNRFEKNTLEGYEFCGQSQLMKIDGISGVLKVAEVVGKMLLKNTDDYEDSWRIDSFHKANKLVDVYAELKKASIKNKFIAAYYKSVLNNKWAPSRRRKVKTFSYELIKEIIENNRIGFLATNRNQELTETEVEKLAMEFLSEKDSQRKGMYLRFFSSVKFPFSYQPLYEIASRRSPKNTRLVEYAVGALQYFTADEIRRFALDKIHTIRNPCEYLDLLVSNYQEGDCRLLAEIANRSDSYEFIHSIVFGFINIYESNSTEECKEPLEIIYNKMNCGIHREDIIRILLDNNALSNTIIEELQFDSNDRLRQLYKRIKKENK